MFFSFLYIVDMHTHAPLAAPSLIGEPGFLRWKSRYYDQLDNRLSRYFFPRHSYIFFFFFFLRQFFPPRQRLFHRTVRNSVIGNKFTRYFAGISSVKSALRQSISRMEITFRSPRVFPIETRMYTSSPLIAFLFCSDRVDNALNATLCECWTKGWTINGKIESHYVLLSCVSMLQRVKLEHENG